MKGKVKLKLKEDDIFGDSLTMYLKLEGEWFYNYSEIIIIYDKYGITPRRTYKTKEDFYNEVIEYISDINNIKRDGEKLMKEVIENKLQNIKTINKEKQIEEILKKIKQPIEIEVKI